MKTTLIVKSRSGFMIPIPSEEIEQSMIELSDTAYKLLMYYYSKGNGWDFKDEQIATTLKTSERMVKRYRKELEDKNYLLIVKGTINNIFVGKQAVNDFKE